MCQQCLPFYEDGFDHFILAGSNVRIIVVIICYRVSACREFSVMITVRNDGIILS